MGSRNVTHFYCTEHLDMLFVFLIFIVNNDDCWPAREVGLHIGIVQVSNRNNERK
jgi:hypothetical protein